MMSEVLQPRAMFWCEFGGEFVLHLHDGWTLSAQSGSVSVMTSPLEDEDTVKVGG